MPELRQDYATKEWVIIATERAKRPHEFVKGRGELEPLPPHDPNCHSQREPHFHWHLKILPRLTTPAGFEIGSGMYINIALPEENAQFLRHLEVPEG